MFLANLIRVFGGRYVVGNLSVVLQCKTIHYFVEHKRGREVVGIIEPPRTIRIQLSFNGCNGTNRAALQEELRTSVLMKSEVIFIFGKCTYMAIFFFLELPYTFNNTFTTFEIYFH